MTPIVAASLSPMDRVMAKPGTGGNPFGIQIRDGPMKSPHESLYGSQIPPDFSILFLSSALSGFWS